MGTIRMAALGLIRVDRLHGMAHRVCLITSAGLAWLLDAYMRHQSRHQLATLDDRALADVGLTRLDVAREIDKPVWR